MTTRTTTRRKTTALLLRRDSPPWAVATLLCGAVVASEKTPAGKGAYELDGIGGVVEMAVGGLGLQARGPPMAACTTSGSGAKWMI